MRIKLSCGHGERVLFCKLKVYLLQGKVGENSILRQDLKRTGEWYCGRLRKIIHGGERAGEKTLDCTEHHETFRHVVAFNLSVCKTRRSKGIQYMTLSFLKQV